MEKPILPKLISLEEYKKRRVKQERVADLSKKSIVEITKLIQEGEILDLEIADLTQFTDDEKYLLQLMTLEVEEARYQKENADNLSVYVGRLEEYVEFLQQEIQTSNQEAIEREKYIKNTLKI